MKNFHKDAIALKHLPNRKAALSLGGAILALTLGSQAAAAPGNPEWTGDVSADWTDGENWSGGEAPSLSGTFVFVKPAASVTAPVIDGIGKVGEANMLFLGSNDDAKLTIINGGQLNANNAIVGNSTINGGVSGIATESGTLSVTGSGSGFDVDFLTLGFYGDGTLAVADGAQVTIGASTVLGSHPGAKGTLTVTGTGSRLEGGELQIGSGGEGVLNISAGATVQTTQGGLGVNAGSSGTATVSGAGSSWTITGVALNVGGSGTGVLTVSDGAVVSSGQRIAIGNAGTLNIGAAAGEAAVAAGQINAVGGIQFKPGAGRLVLNHTDTDYVLAGPITGNGAVDVLAGTTIFTGNSGSYSGALTVSGGKAVLAGTTGAASTTIQTDGVLQIGNGGTSGSLNSDITNNGNLVFNRSDELHHNRVISGSGDVTVAGGVITLSGMNTFTGATNIESGATLALSGQGRINQSSGVQVDGTFDVTEAGSSFIRDLSGSGSVVVGDKWLQITDASQTFSGQFTGTTGGLMVAGGTLTLTGANEAGLGISSGATVNIGGGGTSGSITGNINNYGTVVFDRSDDLTYLANINGGGAVVKAGAGTTTFAGSMNLMQLQVNEGTAQITGTISNSNAMIAENATLIFANPNSATFAGLLSGSGSVVKDGAGSITLSGDSSGFAGDTTVSGGTMLLTGSLGGEVFIDEGGELQVGNGATTGNLLADALNDGTLVFNQNSNFDYSGALSGDGQLIKRGSGTLELSGDYHYTGSTVVENGTIRLTAALDSETDLVINNGVFDLGGRSQTVAGLSGSGGTLALGAGTLTVVQGPGPEPVVFSGGISGTGGFIKEGEGALNLAGQNSFTGQVDVNQGRLAINGQLPGSVFVNNGGTLGGTGNVGAVTVRAGGIFAPGNSIGTINVGDTQFDADSIYEVEVNANGDNDLIAVTGVATLDGGFVSVIAEPGDYNWVNDYVILTATDGVDGEFDDADVDLLFLTAVLTYGENDVRLALVRNDRAFASVASTVNQTNVAAALDAMGPEELLYRTVAAQADQAGAQQAFDALSGELWSTAGTFMMDRTRRLGEMVVGRMVQADVISQTLSNATTSSQYTNGGRTGIWGEATGSWNNVKSDGNAARASQSGYGFVTGIDTLLGDWRIGLAFSHGEEKVQVNSLRSHATVTGSALAAYAGGGWGNLRARIGGSYGWLDVKGERAVAFAGLSEDVSARYDGKSASAFGELSYAATLGKAQVEPFAGVNHVRLRTDGFTEDGGLLAPLSVERLKRDITYTTLGLRLGAVLPVSDRAAITPRISAAWLRGFGDVSAEGRNSFATGDAFSIEGLPATRNALRLEAGAQANILPGGSLGISYVGNIADRWSDHGLKLGFSYSF